MTKKQFEELISAIRELTQAVNALSWNKVTYIPYTQPYVAPVTPSYPEYPKIWCGTTIPNSTNSLPVPQENG